MLKSLRARLEKLEAARRGGETLIIRARPDRSASARDLRTGRAWDATPPEAARLSRGAIVIGRSYGQQGGAPDAA